MTNPYHVKNKKIDLTECSPGVLCILLKGKWQTSQSFERIDILKNTLLENPHIKKIVVKTENLESWDTSLIAFLINCRTVCSEQKKEFDTNELPPDIKELLSLSGKIVENKGEPTKPFSLFRSFGQGILNFISGTIDLFNFMGELTLSLGRLVRGKGQTRWRDFILITQQTGVEALPIITLISFLVGFIMAFVGFTQLRRFGATIYVADLVGIATVREMGIMMASIIMAGRTGAAFAATIGSMKVGEEIDALRTTGISPFDFLVTPRVLALLFMMPMLCLYADFIGVLGGILVTSSFSDVTFIEYWRETQDALTMKHISVGLYKSLVFGVLIALTGCLRGMRCGYSSSAIGDAATSAVVTGITSIIIADAIFALLFDALNI